MNYDYLVVNLNRRKDRLSTITNTLPVPFTRVPAFDGQLTGTPMSGFQNKLFESVTRWEHTPNSRISGVFACWLSHLNAWNRLIFTTDLRFSVVFEDDIFLLEGFTGDLDQIISELTFEFDLIYLGTQNKDLTNLSQHEHDLQCRKVSDKYSACRLYSHINLFTTSSYVISREGARKLIDQVNEDVLMGKPIPAIDNFLLWNQSNIIAFSINPLVLGTQESTQDSDIW